MQRLPSYDKRELRAIVKRCISSADVKMWNGRTIEIDDSGTGDLVGDAFIGLRDVQSGEILFRGIPVGLYKPENREGNRPQLEILRAVGDALEALAFDRREDRLLLCRGNCFDLVREHFDREGIDYIPAVIEGDLQDAVEGRFFDHLRSLGLDSDRLEGKPGKERFYVQYHWVAEDFPNREQFVKRGFPAWQKHWRSRARREYERRGGGEKVSGQIRDRAAEILQRM
jgi:hypothetical protein